MPLVPLTRWKNHGTVGPKGSIPHGEVPGLQPRCGYPVFPECGPVEVACLSALRGEAGKEESTLRCCGGALLMVLIMLGGRGHRFAVIAEVLMVAIFAVILVEFMRPQLQLRKPAPKPEIKVKH